MKMTKDEAQSAVNYGVRALSKWPDGKIRPMLAFPKPPKGVESRPAASDASKAILGAKAGVVGASEAQKYLNNVARVTPA